MRGTRTNRQNKALHLFCSMLGNDFNSRDLDVHTVLGHEIALPWTEYSVRTYLYNPLLEALESAPLAYDHLRIAINEHGVYLPVLRRADYLKNLPQALNDAGLDMQHWWKAKALKGVIWWAMPLVKEWIWRDTQIRIYGKESTTELNTVDPTLICDTIGRWTAERWGFVTEWPAERVPVELYDK